MTCPDCKGEKRVVAAHVHYSDGSGAFNVPFPCSRCAATGEVDDRTPEWVAAGRLLREDRVRGPRGYRNLVTEAALRGVGVVELSRMERGEIEPLPVYKDAR